MSLTLITATPAIPNAYLSRQGICLAQRSEFVRLRAQQGLIRNIHYQQTDDCGGCSSYFTDVSSAITCTPPHLPSTSEIKLQLCSCTEIMQPHLLFVLMCTVHNTSQSQRSRQQYVSVPVSEMSSCSRPIFLSLFIRLYITS